MKLKRDSTLTLESSAEKWMLVTWADAPAITVRREEKETLCLSLCGDRCAVSLLDESGKAHFLSAPALRGNEVILTLDRTRLALYVEGHLKEERFLTHLPDFAGGTLVAGSLMHFEEGYAYTSGEEAAPIPNYVSAEDLVSFRPPCGKRVREWLPLTAGGILHLFYRYGAEGQWGHLASGDLQHFSLCPTAVAPETREDRSFGSGCAVAAFGGIYLFYPVIREGERYVGVSASKNGISFLKSPLRIFPGEEVLRLSLEKTEKGFLLTGETPKGEIYALSEDLYYWN